MNEYEAFVLFSALKSHFIVDSYDFFKYNGKIKTSHSSYEKRNDKLFFKSLAKEKDTYDLFLSNIVNDHNIWVGKLVKEKDFCQQIKIDWQRKIQALSYYFQEEISNVDFKHDLTQRINAYPFLIQKYISKEISLETLCILNVFINFSSIWEKTLSNDLLIWPSLKKDIEKYSSFLKIDIDKCKKILNQRILAGQPPC